MRHDFKCVPIPERMQHLSRDKRGYPVPVIVYVDDVGRPHFTINNSAKRWDVIRRDCCSICGQPLQRGRWFVGGPGSAFHPNGAYIDPAMHQECVHYALRVCPYIAVSGWSKRIDTQTLSDKRDMILVDNTQTPAQPPLFVAVMTVGARRIDRDGFQDCVFVPRKPYRQVEFWRDGVQLTEADGRAICDTYFIDEAARNKLRVYLPTKLTG